MVCIVVQESGESTRLRSNNTKVPTLKTTKRQVLADFRLLWQEVVESTPSLRGDSIAKREEFNNYVDALNKDGIVTDSQAFNWSNPF